MDYPQLYMVTSQSLRSLMMLSSRSDPADASIGSLFARSFLPQIVSKLYKMGEEMHQIKRISVLMIDDAVNTLLIFFASLTDERLSTYFFDIRL